jgi:hypothetical protein
VESRGAQCNAADIGIGEQKRNKNPAICSNQKLVGCINNENNHLVSRDQLAKNIHPPPGTKLLATTGRKR